MEEGDVVRVGLGFLPQGQGSLLEPMQIRMDVNTEQETISEAGKEVEAEVHLSLGPEPRTYNEHYYICDCISLADGSVKSPNLNTSHLSKIGQRFQSLCMQSWQINILKDF